MGYMRDQLTKRGFRATRGPDGRKLYKKDHIEEILQMIAAGTW